jgi:Putative peptidoglycan binding domain
VKRSTWVLAAAAVLAAIATVGGVAVTSGAKPATAAAQPAPANTAQVEKRTLSATVPQDGTLTYRARSDGSPYSVINQARGTYTKLPSLGQVIHQGHVLYRVNDGPVVLLYGPTPAYRTLSAGATGPDVAELNADLVALGYATPSQLSRTSASFGSATTTAVEKLQAAVGVPQTGTLTLGQAVFEPTAVRVTTVSAQSGGGAQTGETVLQGTSTTREVQVALDASQQTSVAVGDKVSITLPNNQTTPGVVSSVGTVATCPSSSGSGGSGSSSAAPGADSCSSASSGSSTTPTITVDVRPSDPAATGTWDQAHPHPTAPRSRPATASRSTVPGFLCSMSMV